VSGEVAEPRRYTLDTSALMAYFADEAGADQVERLLALSARSTIEVYASFMTYMEVLYAVWRRLGERAGKAAYLRVKALPIRRFDASERLLVAAARIKASHDLSVADAWIAATALDTESPLVHKDPEFRALAGEVPLVELPLKVRSARRPSS
jgi:ribonuclease VapC